MCSVDIYSRVRRACLKDGMSAREAARYFNKDRKTIAKMLRHALSPIAWQGMFTCLRRGCRRSEAPHRPTLDAYVGVIDEIRHTDKALIKKTTTTPRSPLRGYSGTERAFGHVDLQSCNRITCLMTRLADPRVGTIKATACSVRPIQLIERWTRRPMVSGKSARRARCFSFRVAWEMVSGMNNSRGLNGLREIQGKASKSDRR